MLVVKALDSVQMARGTLTFLGSPMKACLYVVDGLMIDTGPRNMAPETIPFLQDIPIEQVALTHLHEDHVGLSSWLAQSKRADIFIHSESVAATTRSNNLPWHRRWSWGIAEPFISKPLPARIERDKHTFEVIPTPGHTADHVVLYEKEKGWLFTGDLFVNAHPIQWSPDESADQYIESLQRLLELDFDTMFCGHAGICQNGKELIRRKLQYLLELRDKVAGLSKKGYSPRQINRILFPKQPASTYFTKGEWSSYHLVNSMLESAQARNQVSQENGKQQGDLSCNRH